LKLNGTYQLVVYADCINILGGSVHAIKEKAKALIVASMESRLQGSADKTKCMVMSRDEYAGRSHHVKFVNSSFGGWKISNIWQQI